MTNGLRTIGAIVGVGGCLAAAVGLQVARDRLYTAQAAATDRILYVRSGPAIKRLALDFDALWADVYWIRAIQHYGGERLSPAEDRNFELLFPLLDLAQSYFLHADRQHPPPALRMGRRDDLAEYLAGFSALFAPRTYPQEIPR